MKEKKNFSIYLFYLIPVFLLITVFVYYPVIKGIVFAFQSYNLFNTSTIAFIRFDNFKEIFSDIAFPFFQILKNTLIWVFVSLVLQFLLGFILAFLLKKPFPGRGIYTSFVFYTWAVSGFAIGLIWSWIFNGQFGLMNDILMRLHLISAPIGFLSDPKYAMASVIVANVGAVTKVIS